MKNLKKYGTQEDDTSNYAPDGWINPVNYHPAVVSATDEWRGKTWSDMPGVDNVSKKMNFFLFRRGLYEIEDCQAAARRSISNHFRSAIIAGFIALSSVACAEEPQKRDFRPIEPKRELHSGTREVKEERPAIKKETPYGELELPTNPSEPESSLFPEFPTPSFK